jgi:poly-beta-1,6-N-acetyl-D-glucosamine synthase
LQGRNFPYIQFILKAMYEILLFQLSIALLPLLLLCIYTLFTIVYRPQKHASNAHTFQTVPPVSIILACYNEAEYIHAKINSLLAPENWIPGSEIIVVSGGSTDASNSELLKFTSHPNIQIYIFEERIGKIESVNFAVSKAKHDFLIFSDFRQTMSHGSIANLLKRFGRADIGVVTATLLDSGSTGDKSFIRTIMNKMAVQESRYGSCLNVFGALYAQRKESFVQIPNNILFDDLFVIVSTLVQNKKIVQADNAIINDVHFSKYYGPERIGRLARGLLLFLFHHNDLIQRIPLTHRIRFFIYKYLKLTLPVCTMLQMVSMLGLIILGYYTLPICCAILFLLLIATPKTRRLVYLYISFQYYFAKAIVQFLTGRNRSVQWEKLHVAKYRHFQIPAHS